MPPITSQKTLVAVMRALRLYQAQNASSSQDLEELFYEHDFRDWFVRESKHYRWNWTSILIGLRNGDFFDINGYSFGGPNSITGEHLSPAGKMQKGEQVIERIAAFVATLQVGGEVLRSLQLDGFDVDREGLRLVPLEGPVSAQAEEDALTSLVNKSGITNQATVLKHVSDAHSLYTDGKFHPSLNESRSLVQALIDEVSSETHKNGKHNIGYPGGTKNRIEYLKNVGFFTNDEQAAFESAWGSLSAGSHPGVPEREQARIGLVIALEFGQLMLLKFSNWKSNGYKAFS